MCYVLPECLLPSLPSMYVDLLLYYIIPYNITYQWILQINSQIENDKVYDIDYKSLASLVNSTYDSCLNHGALVLEFLIMLLLTFKFVGQITCHWKTIENTIPTVVVLLNYNI